MLRCSNLFSDLKGVLRIRTDEHFIQSNKLRILDLLQISLFKNKLLCVNQKSSLCK